MTRRIICSLCVLMLFCGCAMAESAVTGGIAGSADMTDVIDIVDPDKTPVTGDMLKDGVYQIAVDSSSAMFKIAGCDLLVLEGSLTAQLRMNSDAYSYMYPGSAEEASQAEADDLIVLDYTQNGEPCFRLPLAALDTGYECAAYSARKELWYPRTLVFRADSLPLAAWREEYLHTVESLGLAEGAYSCEVSLNGAGRATLSSPAALTIKDGVCTAEIVFSTAKIDYVLVDGEKYEPIRTEDGAAFNIPVAAFDLPLSIIVDSTAMKPAVEVPYTVTFDSASLSIL